MLTPQEIRDFLPSSFAIKNVKYYHLTSVVEYKDKFTIIYTGFTECLIYLYKNEIEEQEDQKQYCIDTVTDYVTGRKQL